MLWLEVGPSNNDPTVIARYFLDTVKQLGGMYTLSHPYWHCFQHFVHVACKGAPAVLRCDLGTENTTLAFIQPYLRQRGRDSFAGENSFRYGRSTSNQARYHSISL